MPSGRKSGTGSGMACVSFELPWPPSVNHYWKHGKMGRVFLGEAGKKFRAGCVGAVREWNAGRGVAAAGKVALEVYAIRPDRRKRDIDNILKALLDGLVHAGVLDDDSQVAELHVVMGEVEAPGRTRVTVRRLEDEGSGEH